MAINGRKIVVGVDGSEHSDRALAWAIDEAQLRDALLHVVSVWHVPALVYGGVGFTSTLDAAVDDTFREVAEQSAIAAVDTAREAGVDVALNVECGQTVDVLLRAAEDASMLVVGSRGHGASQACCSVR